MSALALDGGDRAGLRKLPGMEPVTAFQHGESLVGAISFCLALQLGSRGGAARFDERWRGRFASAAAGAAVAYVFVHILPVLERARFLTMNAAPERPPTLDGLGVYLCALAGFVGFYGLERALTGPLNEKGPSADRGRHGPGVVRWLHLSAIGLYVWLLAYFLVRGIERTLGGDVLYAVAMALHLWSLSHSLHKQHGDIYTRPGVLFLSGWVLAGWVCGVLWAIPNLHLLPLISLVAGAVLASSMVTELAGARGGNFLVFAGGAAAYSALLLIAH